MEKYHNQISCLQHHLTKYIALCIMQYMTMKKTQVYLPQEQWLQLSALAGQRDTSSAALIRQAVDDLLDKLNNQRLSWGEVADKVSEPLGGDINIDKELYG